MKIGGVVWPVFFETTSISFKGNLLKAGNTAMSRHTSGAEGSKNKARLQEMLQSIEATRNLALAGNHEFMIYLLNLAQREALELLEKEKS